MERFKSSFVNTSTDGGEAEYDKAVRHMLDDLPFMKKCNGWRSSFSLSAKLTPHPPSCQNTVKRENS